MNEKIERVYIREGFYRLAKSLKLIVSLYKYLY